MLSEETTAILLIMYLKKKRSIYLTKTGINKFSVFPDCTTKYNNLSNTSLVGGDRDVSVFLWSYCRGKTGEKKSND